MDQLPFLSASSAMGGNSRSSNDVNSINVVKYLYLTTWGNNMAVHISPHGMA